MCLGSEAGSCIRPIDFVYHSSLGLRVIKKKESEQDPEEGTEIKWGRAETLEAEIPFASRLP